MEKLFYSLVMSFRKSLKFFILFLREIWNNLVVPDTVVSSKNNAELLTGNQDQSAYLF